MMRVLYWILVLIAAHISAGPARAETRFQAPFFSSATWGHARYMAIADFDQDGFLDHVASTIDGIAMNRGFGTGFHNATPLPYSSGLGALAAGDFDGDGLQDLLLGRWYVDSLFIYRGHGDGSFSSYVRMAISRPGRLAVADLDGDPYADVVLSDYTFAGGVLWRLWTGDGVTFSRVDADTLAGEIDFVRVLDIDGSASVVAGSDSVCIYRDDGQGRLERTATIHEFAWDVAAGDLDADGWSELVLMNSFGYGIVEADGSGSFVLQDTTHFGAFMRNRTVVCADFTGDGFLDLVFGNGDDDQRTLDRLPFGIAHGNGDGTFAPPMALDGGRGGHPLEVADFDRDGRPDVVFSFDHGTAGVMLNQTNASFGWSMRTPIGTNSLRIEVADLENDGGTDVVWLNAFEDLVYRAQVQGGAWVTGPLVNLSADGASRLIVTRIDGDALPDLLFEVGGEIRIHLADGAGGYPLTHVIPQTEGQHLEAVCDLSGDGHPDVLSAVSGIVYLLEADGLGGFLPFRVLWSNPWGFVHDIVSGDFDGTGTDEIAVLLSSFSSSLIAVLDLAPDGDLSSWTIGFPREDGYNLAVTDVDADGRDDVVHSQSRSVIVRRGLAAGGLDTGIEVPTFWESTWASGGDVDGDGFGDIVLGSGAHSFAILHNDGAGNLGALRVYGSGLYAAPQIADLNGDGLQDVVVAGDEYIYSHLQAETPVLEASTRLPALGRIEVFPQPASSALELRMPWPDRTAARVRFYDIAGRLVHSIRDVRPSGGRLTVRWSLETARGQVVRSGVYFAEVCAGSRCAVRRVVVAR